MPKILIVESRYYGDIATALLDGATAALEQARAQFERITVAGALEIPPAILFASQSDKGYDGFVALGCVIRGETFHFDIVAGESARGLMDLGLHHGVVRRQRYPHRRGRGASRRARAARRGETKAATRRARACR